MATSSLGERESGVSRTAEPVAPPIGGVTGEYNSYPTLPSARRCAFSAGEIAASLDQPAEMTGGEAVAAFIATTEGGFGAAEIVALLEQDADINGGKAVAALIATTEGGFSARQIAALLEQPAKMDGGEAV